MSLAPVSPGPRADTPPLSGVAALADRPPDPRRVALVMAAVAALLGLGSAATIEHLLASANREPYAAHLLRVRAVAPPAPTRPPAHVAVLLVDGLRADEAARLPSWHGLRGASRGTIALPTPTLSRPFYHLLFTGAPSSVTGVRSNRFRGHARLDSVMDRVRDAGGRVFIVADGLDWMRRMHGRPEDGGSDAGGALTRLDELLPAFRSAPAPALLVVHPVRVDGSAHADDPVAHRDALAQADRVLATLAREEVTLIALSDHGHVRGGGHGGPEPEVATAPLLIRDARSAPRALGQVPAARLASTIAAHLGVPRPRHATRPALDERRPDPGYPIAARALARGAWVSELALSGRRRWAVPLALLLALLALGPIKRAFGFDRSVLVAVVLWPLLVVAGHLALGRPLSLSGIDDMLPHGVRVGALGLAAACVAFEVARRAAPGGPRVERARRAAASVAWVAAASALFACASAGFALGPWTLSPLGFYLPLLASGAAASALVTMGGALALTATAR